jgi:hypothetical protein
MTLSTGIGAASAQYRRNPQRIIFTGSYFQRIKLTGKRLWNVSREFARKLAEYRQYPAAAVLVVMNFTGV